MTEGMKLTAIYKAVHSDEAVDAQDTLIWNKDGFCWLRGAGGSERDWSGKFTTLPEAEQDCRSKGFDPRAWYAVQGIENVGSKL